MLLWATLSARYATLSQHLFGRGCRSGANCLGIRNPASTAGRRCTRRRCAFRCWGDIIVGLADALEFATLAKVLLSQTTWERSTMVLSLDGNGYPIPVIGSNANVVSGTFNIE